MKPGRRFFAALLKLRFPQALLPTPQLLTTPGSDCLRQRHVFADREYEDTSSPAGHSLTEGYVTADDNYQWICAQCYEDFKERFQWTMTASTDPPPTRPAPEPTVRFRVAGDGRRLDPEPAEQRVLALARRLRRGRSLRELAAELAARGHVARCGRPFSPELLRRLVHDRPVVDKAPRAVTTA